MGVGLVVRLLVVDAVQGGPRDGTALEGLAGAEGEEVLHPLIGLEAPVGQEPVVAQGNPEHPRHQVENDEEHQARGAVEVRAQGQQGPGVDETDDGDRSPLEVALVLAVDGQLAAALLGRTQKVVPPSWSLATGRGSAWLPLAPSPATFGAAPSGKWRGGFPPNTFPGSGRPPKMGRLILSQAKKIIKSLSFRIFPSNFQTSSTRPERAGCALPGSGTPL